MKSSGYSELSSYDGSYGSVTITGAGLLWHASGSLKIGTTCNSRAVFYLL